MLGQAGDEEVVGFQPRALEAYGLAQRFGPVHPELERYLMQHGAIEEIRGGSLARHLERLLYIEVGHLLVGAGEDDRAAGAHLIERDPAYGEEALLDRQVRRGLRLALCGPHALGRILGINDIAVAHATAFGKSGADDMELGTLRCLHFFDHHDFRLVRADVNAGCDASSHVEGPVLER